MIPVIIHLAIALIGVIIAVPVYYKYTSEKAINESTDETDPKSESEPTSDAVSTEKIYKCYRKESIFLCIVAVCYLLWYAFTLTLARNTWIRVLNNVQNQIYWCIVFLIAAIDFKVKKIPNLLVLTLLLLRIMYVVVALVAGVQGWKEILIPSLVGFLCAIVFMGICYFFARGGVGAGDLKLYAVLGFCYGLVGLVAIMLYSLLASVIVGISLLVTKKAKLKTAIPMAPFIIFGLTIYLCLGN